MESLLAALAALATVPAPADLGLEAAEACFEALDYDCADDRLLAVLTRGPVDTAEIVRARILDAQLALARRDDARARTAVRALLAADPAYVPDRRVSPKLVALIDRERPPPPRPLAAFARAEGTSFRLFGRDSERWSEGLGVEVGGGVVLQERFEFDVSLGYSDHRPRSFELEGLTLWTVTGGARIHLPAGPVSLHAGAAMGALRAVAAGVTGTDTYWGFLAQAPFSVSLPVWGGLSVQTTLTPSLLLASDADRLAYSFLLPVSGGVRYAF